MQELLLRGPMPHKKLVATVKINATLDDIKSPPNFFHPKIVLSSSVKSLKILQEVLGIRGMKYRIQFYSRSHQEATEAYLGSLEYEEWHTISFQFYGRSRQGHTRSY